MDIRVSNVKIHFKLHRRISYPKKPHKYKSYSNFFTCREGKYVFTVFPLKGHVNVSGLLSYDQGFDAVKTFKEIFNIELNEKDISIIIDNSTASGQLKGYNTLLLPKLLLFNPTPFTISIRPHFFPCALLRAEKNFFSDLKPATVILFSNGKFVIVGAKSHRQLVYTFNELKSKIIAISK